MCDPGFVDCDRIPKDKEMCCDSREWCERMEAKVTESSQKVQKWLWREWSKQRAQNWLWRGW